MTKHPGTKHPMSFFATPDKTSRNNLPPRTKHPMQFLSPRTKHPMPFLPPRTKHPMLLLPPRTKHPTLCLKPMKVHKTSHLVKECRTKAHWDKSPLGQKPTGQKPTRKKAHWDKSPLGQKPTYMHLTGIGLNWWTNPRGVLSFSFKCRLGPSIYRSSPHPTKKISGISSTQYKYLKFEHPKNILQSVP